MKPALVRFGAVTICALMVAACGGGGGSDGEAPPPGSVKEAIAKAAADPARDTAIDSTAPFTVLQNAGVPAVVVDSPPKVNFTVFSDGAVLRTLKLANVSFVIAKLVPGENGEIDRWINYISRTEIGAPGFGPGGSPALPSARQASSDPKPAGMADQLVYNDDGYYTYAFSTDITNPAKTGGVSFEPHRTHRIAIQLSYQNAGGERVLVNPNFDFTIDGNGHSVPVTDPAMTRRMVDSKSCNGCHDRLSLHGGGRVDTQFCVLCHNPGTTDANSGNVLTLMTMVHKIHAGRLLKAKFDAGLGGEIYRIWGYANSEHDYSRVGFPQDLRNCSKCHSGDNLLTPQGDNWKTRPSKEACLTCHANEAGSKWDTRHLQFAQSRVVDPELTADGIQAKDLSNAQCVQCHRAGSANSAERVHWNQIEEHGARYRMNIELVRYDAASRLVTVKYFLSDPTNGNAAYNLVTPDCTGPAARPCGTDTRFGNLQLRVAYPNLIGQPTAITEFTSYNNGGANVFAWAHMGSNDGSNRYTVLIPVPPDSATAAAAGTARVVSVGQVREPLLAVRSATDPRPEVEPRTLVNTIVQNTHRDFAISGPLTERRKIVATEKCNVCHGALGTTSGSNTLANAFHAGARNVVESCVVCHDPNRMSSTVMTNGLSLQESYQFKRMIHGIHGNGKRSYPFTHGNKVFAQFDHLGVQLTDGIKVVGGATPSTVSVPAGTLLTDALNGGALAVNYAAEVYWPGMLGTNCNACHVDNSYKVDRGQIGAVVSRLSNPSNLLSAVETDPMKWFVITPKAASCTACHDSGKAIGHVASFGGAGFGNLTQAQSWNTTEICADCHSSGGIKPVDAVHGQQ